MYGTLFILALRVCLGQLIFSNPVFVVMFWFSPWTSLSTPLCMLHKLRAKHSMLCYPLALCLLWCLHAVVAFCLFVFLFLLCFFDLCVSFLPVLSLPPSVSLCPVLSLVFFFLSVAFKKFNHCLEVWPKPLGSSPQHLQKVYCERVFRGSQGSSELQRFQKSGLSGSSGVVVPSFEAFPIWRQPLRVIGITSGGLDMAVVSKSS